MNTVGVGWGPSRTQRIQHRGGGYFMDELDHLMTRAFPPGAVSVSHHYQERGNLWITTLYLAGDRKVEAVAKGAYEDRRALGEALLRVYRQAGEEA